MHNIRGKLLASIESGNFLDVATEIYEGDYDNHTLVGKEVATLHNESYLDANVEFLNLKNDEDNHGFFTTRNVYQDALIDIEAPVVDVMRCVKHLTEEAGQDMAAGFLFPTFTDFCEVNLVRAKEVLDLAIHDQESWRDFISPAIIAGARSNLKEYVSLAIKSSECKNVEIRSRAIFSMGRIDYGDGLDTVAMVFSAILTAVKNTRNDQVFSSALKSTFSLYKKYQYKGDEVTDIFSIILANPEDITLYTASEIFMLEKSDIPEFLVKRLLTVFRTVNVEHGGTLRNLDFGLSFLLENGKGRGAIELIEFLLLTFGKEFPLGAFKSLSREIVKNKDNIFSWTVTRWLLSGSYILRHSSLNLVKNNLDNKTELSADLTLLNGEANKQYLLLAERSCGWFFENPVLVVSYIFSLIEVSTEEEIKEITDILFYPLLISYAESVKEYLENLPRDILNRQVAVADDLLERLSNYHYGLESVREMKELKPSIEQREAYSRAFNKKMDASYKESQKDSIFGDVFGKPKVLLYGNSSIHYIQQGKEGGPIRQETPMHSISTSIEFPSLEYLDPHSLDHMLLKFKFSGCTE